MTGPSPAPQVGTPEILSIKKTSGKKQVTFHDVMVGFKVNDHKTCFEQPNTKCNLHCEKFDSKKSLWGELTSEYLGLKGITHMYLIKSLKSGIPYRFNVSVSNKYGADSHTVEFTLNPDGTTVTPKEGAPKLRSTPNVVAVDMGLSVKWASCNLGASSPEQYGDYYSWGEIGTKSTYNWSSYRFGTNMYGSFSKYNTHHSDGKVDYKIQLDMEDDAARQALGGSWRMPTFQEWDELMDKSNCIWTWTWQNNKRGYMVKSKKTGNSIFLPAAGYLRDSGSWEKGSAGNYWSSSLRTNNPSAAWLMQFNSDSVIRKATDRYYGVSIRPVLE